MTPFNNNTVPSGCPCQGCDDRDAVCHGKCERYKEWRSHVDARNEARRTVKASMDTMSDDAKRHIWKKQRFPYNRKRYRENEDAR